MNTKKYCDECKQLFIKNTTQCVCGWRANQPNNSDGRCQYRNRERRCPLPGTVCPSPYGKTPWYCSGHWSCMGDTKEGDAVLSDAELNYEKIMLERRNWREKLLENNK